MKMFQTTILTAAIYSLAYWAIAPLFKTCPPSLYICPIVVALLIVVRAPRYCYEISMNADEMRRLKARITGKSSR